jgi:hypothetical protein
MSLTDFLADMLGDSATAVLFEEGSTEDILVPVEEVEARGAELNLPMLSLIGDGDMVYAVANGLTDQPASAGLVNVMHDVVPVYMLAEPVKADDVPENFDLEVPLPTGEWAYEGPESPPFYTLVDGQLIPENETHAEHDPDQAAPLAQGAPVEGGDEDDRGAAADEREAGAAAPGAGGLDGAGAVGDVDLGSDSAADGLRGEVGGDHEGEGAPVEDHPAKRLRMQFPNA